MAHVAKGLAHLEVEPRPVQVGTHFFRQQYLFAFATQAEVQQYVRTQTVASEQLDEILSKWRDIQPRVTSLVQSEGGIADTIRLREIPEEYRQTVDAFAADRLFQKTFSLIPTGFAMIEVDNIIAPQRTVNLDYVDRLMAKYPNPPTIADLLDICVSPTREMEPIQHLEIAPNTHVFSSPNSDIRFLGAYVKQLAPDDLEHAVHGGLPAAAVISFVGYGGAPVNAVLCGSRLVLNNGFHRVYALRSMGVREIPMVIQQVRNPQLEFPPQIAGLPREYLLGVSRPVVMKDFFEDGFAITLRVRERIKAVTLGIACSQHDVPS